MNRVLGPEQGLFAPDVEPSAPQLSGRDPSAMRQLTRLFKDALDQTSPPSKTYFDPVAEAEASKTYFSAFSLNGAPEKVFQSLSELLEVTHTNRPSYRTARRTYLYPRVDLHPDGKLRGVYTGKVFDAPEMVLRDLMAEVMLGEHHPSLDREFALGPLLASTGFAANMTPLFNTEHSVPQSWFDKQQPMRADLHALFTAEPGCNTNRSNLPFGENGDTSGADCGLRRGNSFEPARNKGAVARATFYFLSRYPGVVSARDLPPESLAVLLKWHEDEPPSLWEKHRNQEIAKIQGNRNPFIDRPEWARSIDFTLGLSR